MTARSGCFAIVFAITFVSGADAPPRRPDVIYKATPDAVVDRMLELADLKPSDVLYDLGCGDGRIVIAAAQRYGVRAVGVDIDPARVRQSLENVRRHGVEHLVTIRQQDVLEMDFPDATVVTMYLLPTLNARLSPRLARLAPGSRVLSHSFAMKGAKPDLIDKVKMPDGHFRTIFLWKVPWRPESN